MKPVAITVALALAGTLAACQTDGNSQAANQLTQAVAGAAREQIGEAMRPAPAIVPGKPVELTWFGSKSFDVDLRDTLRARASRVDVAIPSPFPLNNIPEGLDAWLQAVKQKGGRVVAEPIPTGDLSTRGLPMLLIEVLLPFLTAALKPDAYAGAENYDAKLMYDKASGTVRTVVFSLKQPAI
jgi:hypothetical protein